MMTSRLAVGSVSTLAMGALLLGAASFWLNRPGAAAHGTPWGDIASLSVMHAPAAPDDDKAQLLKLAALKSGDAAGTHGDTALPVSTPAAPPVDASASVPPTAPLAPVPSAMTPSADAAPAPASEPVQMAAAEDAAPPAAAPQSDDAPAVKSNLVNLNTASADALDRMGAGHVGRTIVAHRPYRSVKDLVAKRVLRTSDYQKIESRVRAD